MHFVTYGPFNYVPRKAAEFWTEVNSQAEYYLVDPRSLRMSFGCYLFALNHGKSMTPWYVGKTTAQTGFYGEVLTPHKLRHYDSVLKKHPHHKGVIFLFPMITQSGRFSKATRSSEETVLWLERMLIGMAYARNEQLCNLRDTRLLKEAWIEGVFGKQNPGKPYRGAAAARRALL